MVREIIINEIKEKKRKEKKRNKGEKGKEKPCGWGQIDRWYVHTRKAHSP